MYDLWNWTGWELVTSLATMQPLVFSIFSPSPSFIFILHNNKPIIYWYSRRGRVPNQIDFYHSVLNILSSHTHSKGKEGKILK